MPRVLASCGSSDLVEDGTALWLVERGGQGHAVMCFVFGLLAFIMAAASAAIGVAGSLAAAAIVAVVAVGAFVGFMVTRGASKRARARPVEALPRVIVIDRAAGVLRDPTGRELARLDSIWFETRMQLASSSRALACCWPGGSIIIARGSPFSGSVGPISDALRGLGLRVK